jgi:hypothetical protein
MTFFEKVKRKIISLLIKPVEPTSYEVKRDTLLEYANKFNLDTLVETGTFFGDTVEYC